MSILAKRPPNPRPLPGHLLRGAALALVVATVAGGVASRPAFADDGWRGGWHGGNERHEWRDHEWREREWREREWRIHHGYAYGPPAYVYAPAPVYAPPYAYAPPPVVYAPPPVASLNFVFPLGHR
jgi:hypothetical protein